MEFSVFLCFWFLKPYGLASCLRAAQPKCIYPSCSHNALWQLQPDSCTQVLIFFPFFPPPSVKPFIYLAKLLPLGVRKEPARDLWERTQWIQHEKRSPHNLDLFSFISYLSASTALLPSIILLCVGCMCRYACGCGWSYMFVVSVHPSIQTLHSLQATWPIFLCE